MDIELEMVVVFKLHGDAEKTLCLRHAMKHASEGLPVSAQTVDDKDVYWERPHHYCDDCKEERNKKEK